MSASVQFTQLDMWKPAHELVHGLNHGDANDYTSRQDMWEGKRRENAIADYTGTGVNPEDVRQNGVLTPVHVWNHRGRQTLHEGHHRAIAAYDSNPNTLVPVDHGWNGLRSRKSI